MSTIYSWWGFPAGRGRQGPASAYRLGLATEPTHTSLPPPQNCGLPSILDGPGPFTVFAPSNEAVDHLRDGRLIYLFTAVSRQKERAGDMGAQGFHLPYRASSSQALSPRPGSVQTARAGEAPYLQPWPGERSSSQSGPACARCWAVEGFVCGYQPSQGPLLLSLPTWTIIAQRREAGDSGGSCGSPELDRVYPELCG